MMRHAHTHVFVCMCMRSPDMHDACLAHRPMMTSQVLAGWLAAAGGSCCVLRARKKYCKFAHLQAICHFNAGHCWIAVLTMGMGKSPRRQCASALQQHCNTNIARKPNRQSATMQN